MLLETSRQSTNIPKFEYRLTHFKEKFGNNYHLAYDKNVTYSMTE